MQKKTLIFLINKVLHSQVFKDFVKITHDHYKVNKDSKVRHIYKPKELMKINKNKNLNNNNFLLKINITNHKIDS